jgi:hypothetical protein
MSAFSTSKIAVACGVIGALAGAAVTWSFGARPPANTPVAVERAHPAEPTREIVVQPTVARFGDDEKQAFRALIREELQAYRGAGLPGADAAPNLPPTSPADALAQLSPDRLKVYDGARRMIDDAIQHRSWSNDDRQQLREKLSSLPPDVGLEVVRPLIVAVNNQEVRFEGVGPLF